jgi:hypothetical protein
MVEQNARKALAVADRGHVLERGVLMASGSAAELARSNVIRQADIGAGATQLTRRQCTQPAPPPHPGTRDMPSKNTVCIWYDGTAEEAANFYADTSPTVRSTPCTARPAITRRGTRAMC